jgi:hydrogenase maturation protein HypF
MVKEAGLTGWVRNQSGTVRLVLDGSSEAVEEFIGSLAGKLPPRARLEETRVVSRMAIEKHEVAPVFEILASSFHGAARVSIPADLAMCSDCRADVFNRSSRFYRYPFTTCTNCGPRYTVVEAMPYDRERTALKEFPLCSECMAEYTDALNRRFHAESIACPVCGPQLFWADGSGSRKEVADPLLEARRELARGSIVAVRGLGGYLLVADAAGRDAIEKLRKRKNRPAKPFAVMVRNLDVLRKHCIVSEAERELLCSPSAPIVILNTLKNSTLPLDLLAPELGTLGVMLPTTPLHALLAEQLDEDPTGSFDFLLMTSGNRGGEPVCISNAEAFERLSGIADFFLGHNRTINLRNDDSLAVVNREEVQLWRRARGYAPDSICIGGNSGRTVLAMGAELKNTVCLAFDNQAVLSPHIGNLETPEAHDGQQQVINSFPG